MSADVERVSMSDIAGSNQRKTENESELYPDFSQNYFQLFGLQEAYTISADELEKAYLTLQKQAHPDKFANDSRQQLVAVQYSSFINKAYETLCSPLLRAQYLLDIYGISVDLETITIQDHDFLMEQMELRETLAEIKESKNPQQELKNLMQSINEKITGLQHQFDDLWQNRNNESLTAAIPVLHKMYFFYKLLHEARIEEEQLLKI